MLKRKDDSKVLETNYNTCEKRFQCRPGNYHLEQNITSSNVVESSDTYLIIWLIALSPYLRNIFFERDLERTADLKACYLQLSKGVFFTQGCKIKTMKQVSKEY